MARAGWLAVVALLVATAGCSSTPENPKTLLSDAQAALNNAAALHFHIDSDENTINSPGAYLLSGDGDAQRPDEFVGDIDASVDGLRVPVKILSIDGTFYVQVPFSTTWDKANPSDYGFSDPATLLNPHHGLSTLLAGDSNVQLQDRYRLNGEELEDVSATVSGARLAVFVSTANPKRSVNVKFGIDVGNHQLRQVVLSGLYLPGATSPISYTITLTDYGKTVDVTPPA